MSSEGGVHRETQPLLGSHRHTSQGSARKRKISSVYNCWIVMALISTSYALAEAPLYRLYESVMCKEYYRIHDPAVIGHRGAVPEEQCKLDSIQQELVMFIAKQAQINGWISLVASIHTAVLGRTFGRRFILKLNIACHLCAQLWIYFFCYRDMPIKLTWISSVFLLVASGPEMRQETIFMIISDATPGDDRFTTFTTGQIIVLPFAITGKKVAAILMDHSLWIPLCLGLTAILAEFSIIYWFMPQDPLPATKNHSQASHTHPEIASKNPPKDLAWYKMAMQQTKQTFQVVLLSSGIFFLTSTFLATSIFGQLMAGSVFLQYAEKKLGVNLAQASKLQANSDIMNMISLIFTFVVFGKLDAVILGRLGPWLRVLLMMPKHQVQFIAAGSIKISRFCAIMMLIGFSIIGIAQNWGTIMAGLSFCAAGQAFRMSTRSILTLMTHDPSKDNTTGLFTIIYYLDLAGGYLAINFILAVLFSEGLRYSGVWIGLPLFFAAILWLIVTLITFLVNVRRPDEEENSDRTAAEAESSPTSTAQLDIPHEAPMGLSN